MADDLDDLPTSTRSSFERESEKAARYARTFNRNRAQFGPADDDNSVNLNLAKVAELELLFSTRNNCIEVAQ